MSCLFCLRFPKPGLWTFPPPNLSLPHNTGKISSILPPNGRERDPNPLWPPHQDTKSHSSHSPPCSSHRSPPNQSVVPHAHLPPPSLTGTKCLSFSPSASAYQSTTTDNGLDSPATYLATHAIAVSASSPPHTSLAIRSLGTIPKAAVLRTGADFQISAVASIAAFSR